MPEMPTIETFGESFARFLNEKNSPWLDTETAAAYLGYKPGTLRTWRARGEGPAYKVVHGRSIRYHIDTLNAFVDGEANR